MLSSLVSYRPLAPSGLPTSFCGHKTAYIGIIIARALAHSRAHASHPAFGLGSLKHKGRADKTGAYTRARPNSCSQASAIAWCFKIALALQECKAKLSGARRFEKPRGRRSSKYSTTTGCRVSANIFKVSYGISRAQLRMPVKASMSCQADCKTRAGRAFSGACRRARRRGDRAKKISDDAAAAAKPTSGRRSSSPASDVARGRSRAPVASRPMRGSLAPTRARGA